ncbi:unnamed protein product [Discula destructiva]
MKTFSIAVALLGTANLALAQGVTSAVAPQASPPPGCSPSYDGTFEITVAKVEGAAKRDVPVKRASCSGNGILVSTLSDSVIKDAFGRTGYVASNYQFQYDAPAQAGAMYTAGFSACSNGSLALGGSAVFYECQSGDFYNLYDRNWAAQCSPVEIIILPCGGSDSSSGSGAGQGGDGQVVGTKIITTTIVSALSDGQPQVKTLTSGIPLCVVSQISDGQVQAATTPCALITTTPAPPAPPAAASSLVPVSQYSDGQIQVTPAASLPVVPSGAPATSVPAATGGSSSPTLSSATAPGGAATTGSPSAATSAPATAGAETVKLSSVAALMVGLIGAVAFL